MVVYIPPPKKTHKPTSTITVKEADEKCYSVRADEQSSMSPWVGGFIIMLIINTIGILEITYIFYFSERKKKMQEPMSS